jgi:hypothetical protein
MVNQPPAHSSSYHVGYKTSSRSPSVRNRVEMLSDRRRIQRMVTLLVSIPHLKVVECQLCTSLEVRNGHLKCKIITSSDKDLTPQRAVTHSILRPTSVNPTLQFLEYFQLLWSVSAI